MRIYSHLTAAWNTRRHGWRHRNLRTYSFDHSGKGCGYIRLRKFGDNFVAGVPIYTVEKHKAPDIEPGRYDQVWLVGAKHEYEVLDRRPPMKQFAQLFFVCTPEYLYAPVYRNTTRNNLFRGLSSWDLTMYTPANRYFSDFNVTRDGTLRCDNVIHNGVNIVSDGVRDPMMEIMDQQVYKQGMKNFRQALKLLDVYINRYKVLKSSWRTNLYHVRQVWTPERLWDVYHERLQTPDDFRFNDLVIPSIEQLRRLWINEGYKHGFARIVPRGWEGEYIMPKIEVDYGKLLTV